LREPGEQLTDEEAGQAGRDRFELATDSVRRVRLHVEGVLMGGAAELMQENHRPGAHLHTRASLRPERCRKSEPERAQGADLQHLSARKWRTVKVVASGSIPHWRLLQAGC